MAKKKLVNMFFTEEELKKVDKELLQENYFEQTQKIPDDVKERIMNSIKEYNKLGKMIHREGNLVDIAKNLSEIATFAERFTLESSEEWFDGVTIQRNMKELKTFAGEFGKVATEVQRHQDRMSSLYEDMGHILNRYFEIAPSATEAPSPTTNADTSLYQGDRVKVNMNTVRKHDPTPSYVRKVNQEIARGKGSVKIYELKKNTALVGGGDVHLFEIEVPTNSLTKVIGRLGEVAKFDKKKMEKFVKNDKFLNAQHKTGTSLEVLFNTYVLGDSVQERDYNKIKNEGLNKLMELTRIIKGEGIWKDFVKNLCRKGRKKLTDFEYHSYGDNEHVEFSIDDWGGIMMIFEIKNRGQQESIIEIIWEDGTNIDTVEGKMNFLSDAIFKKIKKYF